MACLLRAGSYEASARILFLYLWSVKNNYFIETIRTDAGQMGNAAAELIVVEEFSEQIPIIRLKDSSFCNFCGAATRTVL